MNLLAVAASACALAAFLLLPHALPQPLRRRPRRSSARRLPAAVRRVVVRRASPAPCAVTEVAAATRELAVLLGAGLPPSVTWSELSRLVGPATATVAAAAAAAIGEGGDVAAALRGAAPDGPARRAVEGLAATWHVSARTGAPVADLLMRYADVLTQEVDAQEGLRSALAAPQAAVRVLLALPPAGLLLGTAIDADPLGVLLRTAPGRVSALAGGVLAALGWFWTRRMLAAARRGVP